jgi:addiction module RelB/DinJ family antitoxin
MAKEERINLRVDYEIKNNAAKVAAIYGFNLSSVITAFLAQIAQTGNIPLNLERKAKISEKGAPGIVKYSKIAATLVELASHYGKEQIQQVYIYGPYSKGEANAKSEVDFYLIPGPKLTQKDIGVLNRELADALKRNVVIVASDDILLPEERAKIEKEKVLLYKAK